MTTRKIIVATLAAGVTLAGGGAVHAAGDTASPRHAAAFARSAQKALAKHRADKAVRAAESAVEGSPRTAAYRTLLGKAYLASGRFPSAIAALRDALSLDPSDGTAALQLALARIGTGDWAGARETLTTHEATIPATDRGLAFALAGDPATAVEILMQAARTPGATANTRQNLALVLGLAGRWQEAKAVASFDVGPAEVDARLMQWMAFARPRGAADQVAALLGVTPIEDSGQPQRLALDTTSRPVAAVAQVMPVAVAPPPVVRTEVAAVAPQTVTFSGVVPEKPAPAANSVAAPVPDTPPQRDVPAAVAAPSAPAPVEKAKAKPATVVARPVTTAAATGNWYVQVGAYANAGIARTAWGQITRRHRSLASYAPNGSSFAARNATYYRLSVGGFARSEASALCRSMRVGGGNCFVRAGAGDAVTTWASPGTQMAMR